MRILMISVPLRCSSHLIIFLSIVKQMSSILRVFFSSSFFLQYAFVYNDDIFNIPVST